MVLILFLGFFLAFFFFKEWKRVIHLLFLFSKEAYFDLLIPPSFPTLFLFCLHSIPLFERRNLGLFSNTLNKMLNLVIFLVSIKAFKWINLVEFNKYVLKVYSVTGIELGRGRHRMTETWIYVPKRPREGNKHIKRYLLKYINVMVIFRWD